METEQGHNTLLLLPSRPIIAVVLGVRRETSRRYWFQYREETIALSRPLFSSLSLLYLSQQSALRESDSILSGHVKLAKKEGGDGTIVLARPIGLDAMAAIITGAKRRSFRPGLVVAGPLSKMKTTNRRQGLRTTKALKGSCYIPFWSLYCCWPSLHYTASKEAKGRRGKRGGKKEMRR